MQHAITKKRAGFLMYKTESIHGYESSVGNESAGRTNRWRVDRSFQSDWLIYTLDLHILAYKTSICGEELGRLDGRFIGNRDFLQIDSVRWTSEEYLRKQQS